MGDIRSRIAADRTRTSVVIQSGSRLIWPPKALSTFAVDEPNISKISLGENQHFPGCPGARPSCRNSSDSSASGEDAPQASHATWEGQGAMR